MLYPKIPCPTMECVCVPYGIRYFCPHTRHKRAHKRFAAKICFLTQIPFGLWFLLGCSPWLFLRTWTSLLGSRFCSVPCWAHSQIPLLNAKIQRKKMIFHGKPEECQVENITYPRILLSVMFKTPSLLLPAWSSQEGNAEQDLWGPLLLGCASCKMRARSWTSPHPWVLPSPSVHRDVLSPCSVIASWQVKALCGQKVYLES